MKNLFLSALLALGSLGFFRAGYGAQLQGDDLARITFHQNLNTSVSGKLTFRDETGRAVHMSQFFGDKPTILLLGYYECPLLCTLSLNGLVAAMQDMKWTAGDEFQVIMVSIDPKESAELAAKKKQNYVQRYGRKAEKDGWHFLTGNEANITELARETGFDYAWDDASRQYAHPSGLMILTPQGNISRYFFGVTYSPSDLWNALRTAQTEHIASPIKRLILLCFHYSPITGKYSFYIINSVRALGILTLVLLALGIAHLSRSSRKARPAPGSALAANAPALSATEESA